MSFIRAFAIPIILIALFSACGERQDSNDAGEATEASAMQAPYISYNLVATHPHDTGSFTEGLLMHEGKLYESTGAPRSIPNTRSLFGEVDATTGKIQVKAELDRNRYFGEGITFLNGKVYFLTWQSKIGFVYDASTFKQLGTFSMPAKEGWGMTTDGNDLIMSEGSSTITFFHPTTYAPSRKLHVTDAGVAVMNLNELEFIKGYIYANIYTTNTIVKIDPATGAVVGKLDLSSLANTARAANSEILEMNGIAYNEANGTLLITGKFWPQIFEIKLDESAVQ